MIGSNLKPFCILIFLIIFPSIVLSDTIGIYVDESSRLNFGIVDSAGFMPYDIHHQNFEFNPEYTYWIKIEFSQTAHKQTKFVRIENPNIGNIVFFHQPDDPVVTGSYLPMSTRPLNFPGFYFMVNLDDNNSKIAYIKINNLHAKILNIEIFDSFNSLTGHFFNRILLFSFLLILLIISLAGIFLSISLTRDYSYFLILSTICMDIAVYALLFGWLQILFWPEIPILNTVLLVVVRSVALFFIVVLVPFNLLKNNFEYFHIHRYTIILPSSIVLYILLIFELLTGEYRITFILPLLFIALSIVLYNRIHWHKLLALFIYAIAIFTYFSPSFFSAYISAYVFSIIDVSLFIYVFISIVLIIGIITTYQQSLNNQKRLAGRTRTLRNLATEKANLLSQSEIKSLQYLVQHADLIIYIAIINRSLWVYYSRNKREKISFISFNKIAEHYPAEDFLRIHRSYFVNKSKIRKVKEGDIFLEEDVVLKIGVSYLDQLQSSYVQS